MWSNEPLHALSLVLRDGGFSSQGSVKLSPIIIDGRETVVKSCIPRGYAVEIDWGRLSVKGYHGSLSTDEIVETFGFSSDDVAKLVGWVTTETQRIASEHGVVSQMEAWLEEWGLTPKQKYQKKVAELATDLSAEQKRGVDAYANTVVEKADDKTSLRAYNDMLLIYNVPSEMAIDIRLLRL